MRLWIYKKWWAVLLPMAVLLAPTGRAADTVVRAVDMTVARGATNKVSVVLDSVGIENGVQLSLCFDTNLLSYVSTVRGTDGLGSSLFLVNTKELTNGHLGLVLGLATDVPFDAGERHVFEVSFRAVAGVSSAVTTVNICDLPLGRELVDVTANPIPATYSNATVTVLGTCTYSLDTNSAAFDASGGVATVSVTANDAGCPWSVQNTNAWISITSPTNNTGSGTVGFTVSANSGSARTGLVLIAGQQFTVTQAALACAYSLSPVSRNHGPGVATNTVSLTTGNGCAWTIANANDWITLTTPSSGSGSATNTYTVAANPNPVARTGLVQIAGQTLTISQDPVVCSYSLSPKSRTHGPGAATNTVSVTTSAGCSWTAITTNSWILLQSGTNGPGNGTVTYAVETNPNTLERVGAVMIGDQSLVLTQRAASCTVSIFPTSASHAASAANGSFDVSSAGGCSWTVGNTNTWVAITSSTNGSGNSTISYSVATNSTALARSGVVTVVGSSNTVNFTVNQAAPTSCTYTLSPTNGTHGGTAETGTVNVTTTTGCAWTASNTNSWIAITSPTSNTGSGAVIYTVSANPSITGRTGIVVIAGQNFQVAQAGASCTYSLSPKSRTHGSGTATNTVSVTAIAGCNWTATTTNNWILLQSGTNGPGDGTVTYAVTANPNSLERVGAVMIGDQFLVLTQRAASCTVAVTPTSASLGAGAASVSFDVTSAGGCPWTVSNTNNWITITSSTNGSGNSTVNYSVAANTAVARSGVVTVVGASNTVNFTVNQAGLVCTYALSPTNRSHGSGAATNTVSLTTSSGCAWTISNTNSWITIESAASGTGSATITYSVLANPNAVARTGQVQIADQTLTLSQDPIACTYSLSPKSRTHGSGTATNTVSVTATAGCSWTATTTNNWILLQSGTNGPGDGIVTYAVTANPNSLERVGAVMIGDQFLVLTQRAASCTVGVTPTSVSLGAGAASVSFDVTSAGGCPWTVSNTNNWITITSSTNGSGNSTVNYSVATNPAVARSGVVTVVGASNTVNFTVNQAALVCTFALSPTNRSHGFGAATNTVSLTTSSGCAWTISNTNSWITIESAASGTGSATITYSVLANPNPVARTGQVQIADQTLTLSQDPLACTYSLSPKSRTHGSGAATNTVSVTATAACNWTATTTNNWILLQSGTNGPGNGTVTYAVSANPNGLERIGAVMIGDQFLVLTQRAAACTVAVTPTSASLGSSAASVSFDVTSAGGCPWTVSNTNNWITITSSTNGSGNSTVNYSVAANTAVARSGVVTVVGASNTVNFTVNQAALVCTYALSPTNRSHGSGAATNTVSLTASNGCAWTISNTNSWITIESAASGSGSATITYSVLANPNSVARTGQVQIAGQTLTLSQDPIACTYSLSPKSRTHGSGAATNTVSVTAIAACNWTATTTNNWILLQSGTNGPGNGTVTYSVSANPNGLERVGAVMIGDQFLVLTQRAASCTVAVTPTSASLGSSAASVSFDVTSAGGCPWTVSNTNSWITINSSTNGSGNTTVNYSVAANTAIARSGVVTVAGPSNSVNFTVNQAGSVCTYALSPTNRSHGAGAATNTVSLTTSNSCAWTISNTNSWITIESAASGSGSASITYSVQANPGFNERTGLVMIADQTLTLIQHGAACDFSISPTNRTHGFSAATNSVSLAAPVGCAWTIVNTNDWVTITSATSGTGSNTVNYVVAENQGLADRTGVVLVGGQPFGITQHGVPCTISISPTSRTHGYGATTGTVSVAAIPGCAWSVATADSWITILSDTNGTGSNTLTYAVAANPTMLERTGVVMIADQFLTLIQHAAPCTFALSATSRTHGYSAATNSVTLTTPLGCPWNVSNTNGWITITSPTNGTGNVTISYTVDANPDTFNRTGVVIIADQTLTLRQLPAPCSYGMAPTNATYGIVGGTGLVSITTSPNCTWAVTNTNSWITITTSANGTGNGIFIYTVASNSSPIARSGIVQISGEEFLVSQVGVPCNFTIAPTSRAHGAGAESNSVTVTTGNGCPWTVVETNSWITVTSGANGAGSGTVNYTVDANPTIAPRSGVIVIAGEVFTITQQGAACTYRLSPTNRTHGSGAATGSVAVTALAGCDWSVGATDPWITITSALSGSGNGNVSYSVVANSNLVARTGVVMIADQILTLVQQAAVCTFSVSPTNRTHGNGMVTGTVSVTTLAGCSWTALSTNDWITFLTSTNVTGSGSVTYMVETNQSIFWRTGNLVVADRVVTLAQRPTPCTYLLSPSNAVHSAGDEIGFVTITAPGACPWTVESTNDWITLMPDFAGSGNGSFSYEVAANPLITARTGFVVVADQLLTVAQSGVACVYSLSPSSRAHDSGAATGSVSVTTLTGCDWTVGNTNTWITIASGTNGTGSGNVTYTLDANVTAFPRTGVVTIASQAFTLSQSGAPCTYTLSPVSRTHSSAVETGSVGVTTITGCSWTATTTNSWIAIVAGASGSGSGSVTYTVATNPAAVMRAGYILIGDQNFMLSQAGAGCSYTITPLNRTHGAGIETGSVGVTTATGCAWTVSNTNSWITIGSGTNGSGTGTVVYTVASNAPIVARSGVLIIAGQLFTINQAGTLCSFVISPTTRSYGSGPTNGTVAVTTSNTCGWTTVNTNTWITLTSGTNGTASGTVAFTVVSNATAIPRSGVVTIAGQPFTVSQAGAACSYAINPTNRSYGANATNGSVAVTAIDGCDWTVSNTNSWITIDSGTNGSGAGTVNYSVAASQTALTRTGVVLIATRSFTLIQTGVTCTYALTLSNRTHGAGVETGSVDVTTFTGCTWTVSNTNSWITITSGTNGSDGGTVAYTVASNGTAVARSGVMTIAGRSFTVNQNGAACSFVIAPTSRSYSFVATNGSVNVTSLVGCAWTALTSNNWITITSATNGSGNGSVSYTVASNATSFSRTGGLTIAGQDFTVTQSGVPCTYSISPTNRSYGAGATNGTVALTAPDGCAWAVVNSNAWITLPAYTSGTGTGSVDFLVAANPTGLARTGVVVIASQPFTVSQSGVTCTYALTLTNRSHGAGNETGSVDVITATGCAWTVGNTNSWIAITSGTNGSGGGTVVYTVASNASSLARSGLMTIAGQSFTVNQTGAACTFSLNPTSRNHTSAAETSTVSVVTLAGCTWNVSNPNSWILILTNASGTGSLTVTYAVTANPSTTGRTGSVDVSGQSFTVTQLAAPCTYSISPVSWVHHVTAETGMVSVTSLAGCAWTAVNTNSWVTITAGASGTGSGAVTYSVAANPGPGERSGVMTIAGQPFGISQQSTGCTYKISPTSRFHGSGTASNTVSVTASNGCSWGVINTNTWVTILSNATGSGSAVIGYSVSSNRNPVARSGVLNIAGEYLTLTQWGTNCGLALTPINRAHGSLSETGLVTINASTSNCTWSATTTNSWITINTATSGTGNGSLGYTVASNSTSLARTGVISVSGEIFTVTQPGLPCSYAIAPSTRSHGSGSENASVNITAVGGCAWSSATTNSWITITSGASGSGDGTLNYTVDANPAGLSRSGVLTIAGQPFTVTQAGAPCVFTISPTNGSYVAAGSTGLVTVATIPGCSWTADNTNSWIQITSAADGTGSGSIGYSVAANPSSISRTGLMIIAGRTFGVTQSGAACTFSISPSSRVHGGTAETGLVTVTSIAGCTWTASNTNSWITLSGTNGTGSGSVGYTLAANASLITRTGVVVIAGQTFTLSQLGASCTYALVPTSRSHGSGAETSSVGVAASAGCAWSVLNTNSWIQILSGANGNGSGTVGYSIDANSATASRSGTLNIAGQNFAVTQAGLLCTYTLSPSGRAHSQNAESGTVVVTAGTGCAWTVVNTNGWINIDSGASGSGSGTVAYSVTANAGLPRSGNLLIGGQGFAVSQATGLRLLRVVGMSVALGQTNKLLVVLDSAGDENGLGFSVCYDTNVLTYVKAVRGLEATNASATLNVNTGSTNRGRLGLAMALNADQVFPAGSNTVVEIAFRAAPGTNAVTTSVSLCDLPIGREVVDVLANPVATSYADGTVAVVGTCTYSLAAGSVAFDESGGNGSVGVNAATGCSWTVTNTNSWIAITSGPGGSGNGTVTFTVSPNGGTVSRTGLVVIAGQNFTVSQSAPPCSYVILPTLQTHGTGAETGTISLTTLGTCAWTASASTNWITVTSAASGAGSSTVNYSVDANPSSIGRTGAVLVAGQTFTVRQSGVPCTYAIAPSSRAHGSVSETGLVTVTAAAGCAWTVANGNSWITITSGASGSGSGSVGYSVAFNPNLTGRTGVVAVAGQSFTVTQAGNPCAVTLSPTNVSHVSSGGTGLVSVAAAGGCTWTVGNTNTWITITSSTNGTGNGSFGYSVASNPSGTPRTGGISVSGKFFTVDQAGAACVYAIAPSERSHGSGSEAGLVSVATFSGCGWTVSNSNSWITILSPTNLVIGSGSVSYSVSANPSGLGRTGLVLIAGMPYTVSQAGAPCAYAISPTSRSHGFGVESGSVTLNSVIGCPWAVLNSNSWITITSETNGIGPWGVNYTVTNNPTGLSRTGVVSIAGQAFTVTQAPAPCTYAISPTNRTHVSGATTNTITVTTLVGCAWSVANANPWITIQSSLNNAGSGAVTYSVDENTTAFGRTGTVTIAGLTLTLVQSGAPCTYAISPTNRTHGYAATTNTVDVTSVTGCPWTISNTNNWISFLSGTNGTGSVSVTYAVTANPASFGRTGLVTIAGQTLALAQSGAPCVYVLTPASASPTSDAQTGQFSVGAIPGCTWTVNNTNSWITITSPTNGTSTGTVAYLVSSNASSLDRVGLVSVAGQNFTVTQAGMVCTYTLSPTNGSLSSGNVTGLVSITTSPSCNWVIVNTNTWIAIKSPATESGTGSGLVRYTAAANPNPSVRQGTLLIGGVPFTVSQLGSPCTYSLSPTSRLHGSLTETNTINVLTVSECAWTAVSTNPWITILSGTNGSGNSLVTYFVDANPAALDRTGIVMVAGMNFPVTQLGAVCLYSLTSSNTAYAPTGGTGSVSVAATPGCTWTVSNTNTWIIITSGASGTNNGLVRFSVAANFSPFDRSGFLRIGGQTISITQTGIVCSFAITPTNGVHGPAPETNQVSVLTSNLCPWSVSNTNSWITILSPTNSSGNSNVTYAVSLNLSPNARSGQFIVAGQTYTVAQSGIVCTFAITPTNALHSAAVENGQVSVVTSNICPWTVNNTNAWITILSPTNGTGNASVLYSVATNTSVLPRSGQFIVAGQTYTVTQAGFICTFALNPTARAHSISAATGLVTVTTGNGCAWSLASTNNWISFIGSTNRTSGGFVSYVVAANAGIPARTGVVNIAGQLFTVTQYGTPFLSPSNKTVPCGTAWSFDPPVLSGTCGDSNSTLTVLSTVTNAGCGSGFSAVRRWDALDGCSNRVTITQTVSVVVVAPPIVTCAAARTVACGSAWTFDTPTAIESCGGTNVTIVALDTVTNNAGACGGTFTATRIWQAIDGCSNSSTCSQTVRLIDITPPVLTCSPSKTLPCGAVWDFDAPTAFDSCDGTNVTLQVVSTVTNTAGLCSGTFTATRTWESIDGCTNRSTCSQTVTVTDTTAPSLTCTANKSVECGVFWNFDMPVVIDSCAGTNVTLRVVSTVTNAAGACGNTFSATRTWEAFDSCSNRSTCLQTVTVVDTTPPTLVCQLAKLVQFGTAWSFDAPTVTDSCGPTGLTVVVLGTVTNLDGSCGNTYTVTRTWQATDGCSNRSTSCSQSVRVIDVTPPVWIAPTNKIVTCGSAWTFDTPGVTDSGGGTNVTVTVVSTVTNNTGFCGGTFTATRTWQATDSCTNTSTCSQRVTVIDITPPVVACAVNKTVPCGTAWNFDAPTATDSCSGTNVTLQVVSTVTNTAGLCGGTFTATRTWEAVDGCTNRSTCSQTVTVIDATPPVLTCVANKSVECGLAWSFDLPAVTDSCVGTNVTLRVVSTVTNASGACGGTFTATRTWEAVDGCTNRSTCSQTVTLLDTTPPTLLCSATKTTELGFAWSFDPPTVSDSCSATGLTVVVVGTVTNTIGSCGGTYTVTRTWQAIDGCSNRSASCSQLIRVIDSTPPLLSCLAGKSAPCGSAWTFDTPTATDPGVGTSVAVIVVSTVTNNAGLCGGTFTATRTWQATDGCSNSSTCSQTVNVFDITPPVLACGVNKTVPCGTAWNFDAPTATDSCSGTNVTIQVVSTVTNTAGLCGGTFTATRTWEAVDGCTNRSTCSQTVTVIDATPPVLTCVANKAVDCGLGWNFDLPEVTDSCVGTNVTLRVVSTVTNVAGACGNTYTATRTWEAIDACTNRSTCSQTVSVVDTTPPTLVCPATKIAEFGAAWSFDTPSAADSCSTAGLSLIVVGTVTNTAGSCGRTYTATRTWQAIDGCSNRSISCSQQVRVIDSTPPVLTCPADKFVICGSAWNFDVPTATDSADGTNVVIILLGTVTNSAGACGGAFNATRTWQATDGCSNSSTCSQTVRLIDATPPVLTCGPNKTVACGTAWNFDAPTATDACSGTNVTLQVVSTVTNTVGLCGGTYTVTRTWESIDGCTNRSTCSQTVSVVDTTPPTLVCPATKTAEFGAAWSFDTPSAADSCSTAGLSLIVVGTVTNTAGSCGRTYTATRTWQAIDGCSNRSISCSQQVRVIDSTPPVLTCPADKFVICGSAWNFDVPTANDSADGTNVVITLLGTVTNSAGACGGAFNATRTWQATDGCSNSSSCSQTVRLIDVTPPVLACGLNKTAACGTAWNFDAPTAIDACSGTNVTLQVVSTVTNTAGLCSGTYTATRTWESIDGCTNRSTCSQTVSVVDTTPPTLVCPATKTAEFGAAWSFDTPTVADSCSAAGVTLAVVSTVTNTAGSCGSTYTVTRTWQATDGCSNRSANCSQLVRVLDTTPPVLVCAAGKLVACDGPWTFDPPTATDSADGTNVTIVIVSTITNGTCVTGFSATRTWQAIDGCSNRSATCSQSVSAISQASIAGIVSYYPTNYATPGSTSKRLSPVSILVTGGTNLATQTAADGNYNVALGAGGTYTVTPQVTNGNPAVNGVSTLDISLIRRHILNIASLDTPYKLLAGDVNGSRSVTTLDISLLRRVILGVTNSFPMGPWRFVPSDYAFPDPLNPWDAPTNRSYTNLVMALTNQDFMGIKLGDVNNSWVPPVSLSGFVPAASPRAASLAFAPEVTFAVSRHTNQPGDTVAVQVTASGFSQVTSAQWTLAWDPSVLRYKGTGKYGLKGIASGNFGTPLTDSGRLTFSWDDPDGLGVTTPDGSTVFAAIFEVIGAGGSVSPLVLSGSATETEVGVNFSEANLRAISGSVTVLGPTGELPSQPQLASVVYANGTFGVPQQTVPGRRYILEYTDTLPTTNWIPLPPVIGDGSVLILSDPGAATRQRFYRLRIE